MKESKIVKAVLIIAGIVGIIVGGANLIVPIEFNASSGIDLAGNISLINEMRASGGGLLLSGIFITLGAFIKDLTYSSILLATMMYLGYGLSRAMSIYIDGMPSDDLVSVVVFEIIVGLISLFVLLKYRKSYDK